MSKPRKSPESATPRPGTPFPRHSATPPALRQRAEGSFRDQPAPSPEHLETLPPEETQRLFHELRVHQIELETQNEELRRVLAELEASQRRYFDLYDLAPVGYFTLSEPGLILEANLTAATLLGVDRGELVNQPLPCFILKEDQDLYYHHRKQLFETVAPQESDLRMVKPDGTAFWAHLAATTAQDADGAPVCRTVMSDMTERKQAEAALGQRGGELAALNTLGQAVNATLALEPTTTAALQGMLDAVHPDLAYLFLRDGERLILKNVLPSTSRQRLGLIPEHHLGECLCGLAVRDKQPMYSRDIFSDPRCTWEECKRAGFKSFAALPLTNADEVIGVIGLASDAERDFERQGRFLETLASQVSISLVNARLFETAQCELAERKRAEEALREQRDFAEGLIETAQAIILVLDTEGRIVRVNRYLEELSGYTQDELQGKDWFATFLPEEDRDCIRGVFKQAVGDIQTRGNVNPIVTKDGRQREIEWYSKTLKDVDGKTIGVLAIGQDITEREQAAEALRASEEKYRLLFESAGDAIFIIDADARLLAVNPLACERLGYTHAELMSMTIDQVSSPEEARHVPERTARLMKQGHLSCETVYQRKDGSFVPTEVSARRITWYGQPAIMTIARDITERKRAEQTLRESEEAHRALVAGLPDIVMRFDRDGRHLFVSDNVRDLVDLPAAQFIGKSHRELGFPEAQCRIWKEALQGVFDSGAPFETELMFEGQQGSKIHNWRLVPERDAQGAIRSVLSLSRDVTAHRRAEQDYRMLFREMLDGFAVHEIICNEKGEPVDYRFLAVNPAFERMTGLKAQEIVGRTVLEVLPSTKRYWIETYGKVALSGEPAFFENYHADLKKHFEVTAFRPAFNQFVCIFANVTERKLAEAERERLSTAVEQAAEAIVITDPEGTILYVNPSFERITGYPREEAVGQNPRLLKSGRQNQDFYRKLWDTIKRGETWRGQLTNRRKDGMTYEEECSISPVLGRKGEITNFVASKQDITQDLALAEQLRQVQKMEVVGQLAAGIAHDFNNLLTVIRGHVDLAKRTLPHEHIVRESLDVIDLASRQASGVTRGLLTFSGRSATEKAMVNLGTVLRDAGLLLRHLLPTGISLEVNAPAEPPLSLNADPIQLQQALINLTLNARDAMPKGGRIRIGLSSRTEAGSSAEVPTAAPANVTACIEIRDDGAGMSDEVKAHLFEPFFTTKPRGRGTGLGMSIVRSIVQNHGGRLEVESTPGTGTTIRAFLPGATHKAAVEVASAAASRPGVQGEVVLLAEYDRYVAGIIATGLQEQGYQVIRANDGDQLWRQYEERRGSLRLLVLDMDCPGRSILDCLAAIRTTGDPVPVILTTAKNANPQVVLGPHDVLLRKPFRLSDLIRTAVQATAAESPKECSP